MKAISSARPGALPLCLGAVLVLPLTALDTRAERVFFESGGRVVVEAEHFSSRVDHPTQRWLVVPGEGGAGGIANARGDGYQIGRAHV